MRLSFRKDYAILLDMKKFETVRYTIPIEKENCHPTGKIRIVLLSDLHNWSYGKKNESLIREIGNQKPDLIAVAGDMLTSERKREEQVALELMKALAEKYPVYYGNGNHEYRMKLDTEAFGVRYERYARALRKAGVVLLENEYADLTIKGVPLRIYGLQIPWRYYKRFCFQSISPEGIRKCLGKGTKGRYQILLAHNPASFRNYEAWGAELTLSGHLHGGFIRVKPFGGLLSPQCVPFPRYDKGVFAINGRYMVVSAGLGSHSRLPRIGNPTELIVIDLIQP